MNKYGMWGALHEPTPFRVGGESFRSFGGAEDAEAPLNYAMRLGDLARYSRTNPGLSLVVHELARFMQRPGPEHIDAAHRVLRYTLGHLGAGLTYHGSGAVLEQSYDHLSKLTEAFDADFQHAGAKATSGVLVFSNGAAVVWKTRRRTAVSLNSTEPVVKAMAPGVEVFCSLTGLWDEFIHQRHGSVRVLDNSAVAIAQFKHGMDS